MAKDGERSVHIDVLLVRESKCLELVFPPAFKGGLLPSYPFLLLVEPGAIEHGGVVFSFNEKGICETLTGTHKRMC